ncbi:leucine-rich repeat flightless-interacting protein 1 isoform X17 [Canis lupus familiaris]|uniref:leucine-rich repeat flightless-interacting protein 1 isoform X17 n=1 Tax=Canis lupus familiaris TaxID=9615 RepID=UPI0018F3D977|nr:leucine-rich repeat flightless-interacting protein 1 isoform X17 [Canis lupus familiaris]XP_038314454.1 leucine-rich repeat flightless-interacting protein 1 isoform X17 [Canis lupus familiaris]XP_038430241.1 leucine-rich repeat flightless-interacting protein 1 isoform X17 [Canis lupus familiaris]
MDMGSQGSGRRRPPTRERLTAEDDALNQIAREAEARLAAKRAARAEAREIRMKELERQQKEIYQVQKKYYGLDTKWGDIEQWMEDSERYSRRSRRNTSASDEDERMSVGSRGSLRTNGYDGDLYGSQSLGRRSGRVEERPEKDFTEKGSRSLPGLSAATLASLGGTSSRRGSGDTSISVDTEASIREIKELSELKDQIQDVEGKYMQGLKEMKDSLAEVEEKYKKAMVSNAQLDNEKTNFMYQVDTLKDMLLELEEQLAESRRQYEDKSKEFEREKHAHSILQFQFAEVKEALKQREEMLEEIRQLQQKQASYIREISDLQETIEWKDKKIGALERQKEFFDSIRSDRDDLREEVVMLKEELKKHGIVLNSDIATNGETSETLNNVGHQGPSKITKEELNALKTTGDGTLGRASEVEVKSEIVENVGKREILQNSEQEQHREDPAQECVDTEVLHPGENAEDQKASEDSAPSLGVLADATNEEQAQNQILENASFLENTAQVESNEVTGTPDDRTGAPLEQSECLSELVDEIPGPGSGQDSCNASDIKKQSKESAEKQEDLKTSLGEDSTKPCQESAPLQTSEVGGLDSADPGEQGGSPTEGVVEAGLMGLGEQVGTGASGPPTYNNDNMSHDEECAAEAHTELDTSTGHALDKELSRQEAAEPPELPGQRAAVDEENDEKEDEERGLRDEEPGQTEVQDVPCCPAAESSPQGATGLAVPDAKSKPLVTKEPEEEKSDQKGDALASSQKKIKNKKKKNKKKSPAPVETLQDAKKELTFQNSDGSEVKEGEHAALSDTKPVVKTQNEVPESPKEKNISGSSEKIDCPENLKIELAEKLDQEDNDVNTKKGGKTADGDTLGLRGDTTQSSDMSASDKELDEAVRKDDAKEDGAAHSSAPEPGHGGASSSALPENEGPFKDTDDAPQTGSTEQHETAEGPSQIVGKAVGNDHVASAGELGASNSEGRDKPRGGSEKGKSNEECTMS